MQRILRRRSAAPNLIVQMVTTAIQQPILVPPKWLMERVAPRITSVTGTDVLRAYVHDQLVLLVLGASKTLIARQIKVNSLHVDITLVTQRDAIPHKLSKSTRSSRSPPKVARLQADLVAQIQRAAREVARQPSFFFSGNVPEKGTPFLFCIFPCPHIAMQNILLIG